MYDNKAQSRKWLLTINNPLDHGMTHDEIIDRAQKFNPDYVSPKMPVVDSFCTMERYSRHTGLTIPQALQASIPNRI